MINSNFSDSLIFNIFKPAGMTSYDIIRRLKKIIHIKKLKIGHFGTLDPFATGVLLVGIGQAPKLTEYVHKLMPKTYLAIGVLGQGTDTGDLEGSLVNEGSLSADQLASWDLEKLKTLFNEKFVKQDYLQVPPHYSATKHRGKPLHKWARAGQMIQKEPVKREIIDLVVEAYNFPCITFKVTVSTGTYIRTLFEDMAKLLGTYGHLKKLQRISIGHIAVENSLQEDFWAGENDAKKARLLNNGLEIDKFLPFSKIFLPPETEEKYKNGIPFSFGHQSIKIIPSSIFRESLGAFKCTEEIYWAYGEKSNLLGLCQVNQGLGKTVFNTSQSYGGSGGLL